MIFGIILFLFAGAGLGSDAIKAEKPCVHADIAGARAEFAKSTAADWALYPCVGICSPKEISHGRR